MKLSPVYNRMQYAWVYETGHKTPDGDVEVEIVGDIFFTSIAEANEWFSKNRKSSDYINVNCVPVGPFNVLTLPPKNVKFKVTYVETKTVDVVVEAPSQEAAEKLVRDDSFSRTQVTYEGIARKIEKAVLK